MAPSIERTDSDTLELVRAPSRCSTWRRTWPVRRARSRLGAELRWAFENVGFYYLRGHGIPQPLIDATFAQCGPPGRLTSRLRQRSIAAQAGRGRNEVEVGARHARECPRISILSTCGLSGGA